MAQPTSSLPSEGGGSRGNRSEGMSSRGRSELKGEGPVLWRETDSRGEADSRRRERETS